MTKAKALWMRTANISPRSVVLGALALAILSLIVYPIFTVLRLSFLVDRDDPRLTSEWYLALIEPGNLEIIRNTIVLVLSSSLLALVIGFALAWMLERVDVPIRAVGGLIPIAPLLIPPVVGAAAWSFLLSGRVGYINSAFRAVFRTDAPLFDVYSMSGIVFVTTLYVVPYAYTIFYPALRRMDGSLEEAAHVSGAGTFATLRTITLGVLRPAIAGALVITFVIAISQFGIPLILGRGNHPVLTTAIYRAMSTQPSNPGLAGALSTVILIPSLVLLWLNYRILGRGSYATVKGKVSGSVRIRSMPVRAVSTTLVLLYGLVAIGLPVVGLVLVAFRRFWDGSLEIAGFTMQNLAYVWNEYPTTWEAIRTSAFLGVVGGLVSVLVAFLVAYVGLRARRRSERALDFLGSLPLGVPTTVFGLGFLLAFSRPPFPLYGTPLLLLIAYFVIFLPHAVRMLQGPMAQVAPELEESARVFGSGWAGAMNRITLPLVLPGVVGAWALLFILLTREVPASAFLATLRMRLVGPALLDMWGAGSYQNMAAFSLIIVVGSGLLILIGQLAARTGDGIVHLSSPPASRAEKMEGTSDGLRNSEASVPESVTAGASDHMAPDKSTGTKAPS